MEEYDEIMQRQIQFVMNCGNGFIKGCSYVYHMEYLLRKIQENPNISDEEKEMFSKLKHIKKGTEDDISRR